VAEVTTPGPETPAQGLLTRLVGVIVSPRETYASVAARPRALGVLAVTILISAGVTFWFQGTEAGQKVIQDQMEQTARFIETATGNPLPDEQYEAMLASAKNSRYQSAAYIVIATPIMCTVLAGILLGVFNGILGGNGRFKQVFAVVAHSGVIWTLAAVFNVLMALSTGRATGASSLAVFFPMLDDGGFATYFLRAIDVFYVWGFVNLAIGLAVLYRRRTGPIAIAFLSLYFIVAVLIALVRSTFGGS
jgi:hypothetical protein